jgi:hypothetical protein
VDVAIDAYSPNHNMGKIVPNPRKPVVAMIVSVDNPLIINRGMLPISTPAVAIWKRRFARLRLVIYRITSAITVPATGAINMVKNPKFAARRLPRYARIAAEKKAVI